MMGQRTADRDIGIDTYGYDYDESLDDNEPVADEQEYDDDDPRRPRPRRCQHEK